MTLQPEPDQTKSPEADRASITERPALTDAVVSANGVSRVPEPPFVPPRVTAPKNMGDRRTAVEKFVGTPEGVRILRARFPGEWTEIRIETRGGGGKAHGEVRGNALVILTPSHKSAVPDLLATLGGGAATASKTKTALPGPTVRFADLAEAMVAEIVPGIRSPKEFRMSPQVMARHVLGVRGAVASDGTLRKLMVAALDDVMDDLRIRASSADAFLAEVLETAATAPSSLQQIQVVAIENAFFRTRKDEVDRLAKRYETRLQQQTLVARSAPAAAAIEAWEAGFTTLLHLAAFRTLIDDDAWNDRRCPLAVNEFQKAMNLGIGTLSARMLDAGDLEFCESLHSYCVRHHEALRTSAIFETPPWRRGSRPSAGNHGGGSPSLGGVALFGVGANGSSSTFGGLGDRLPMRERLAGIMTLGEMNRTGRLILEWERAARMRPYVELDEIDALADGARPTHDFLAAPPDEIPAALPEPVRRFYEGILRLKIHGGEPGLRLYRAATAGIEVTDHTGAPLDGSVFEQALLGFLASYDSANGPSERETLLAGNRPLLAGLARGGMYVTMQMFRGQFFPAIEAGDFQRAAVMLREVALVNETLATPLMRALPPPLDFAPLVAECEYRFERAQTLAEMVDADLPAARTLLADFDAFAELGEWRCTGLDHDRERIEVASWVTRKIGEERGRLEVAARAALSTFDAAAASDAVGALEALRDDPLGPLDPRHPERIDMYRSGARYVARVAETIELVELGSTADAHDAVAAFDRAGAAEPDTVGLVVDRSEGRARVLRRIAEVVRSERTTVEDEARACLDAGEHEKAREAAARLRALAADPLGARDPDLDARVGRLERVTEYGFRLAGDRRRLATADLSAAREILRRFDEFGAALLAPDDGIDHAIERRDLLPRVAELIGAERITVRDEVTRHLETRRFAEAAAETSRLRSLLEDPLGTSDAALERIISRFETTCAYRLRGVAIGEELRTADRDRARVLIVEFDRFAEGLPLADAGLDHAKSRMEVFRSFYRRADRERSRTESGISRMIEGDDLAEGFRRSTRLLELARDPLGRPAPELEARAREYLEEIYGVLSQWIGIEMEAARERWYASTGPMVLDGYLTPEGTSYASGLRQLMQMETLIDEYGSGGSATSGGDTASEARLTFDSTSVVLRSFIGEALRRNPEMHAFAMNQAAEELGAAAATLEDSSPDAPAERASARAASLSRLAEECRAWLRRGAPTEYEHLGETVREAVTASDAALSRIEVPERDDQ